MKKGAELALNFMLRLVFGMIAIFLINGYLQEKGLDACVGINALSALTSGSLPFFCWNDIINTVFHKFLWKTRNGGAQKCVCYYRRKGTLSYEST